MYSAIVKIFEKRRAEEIQINYITAKEFAFGFHFIWNFIQYSILGFPEFEKMKGLLASNFIGSDFLTDYPVGLESSIITFILGLGIGLYFLHIAYRKGNFIVPRWRRLPE